jgi:CMP-N-acetylneuraminic acid synthetase
MNMKNISVVINGRINSTRIPQKLISPFAGTTLIEIALAKLDRMTYFNHRYLAVAEKELITLGKKYKNIEILERNPDSVKKGINPINVTFAHYLQVPSDYVFIFNPCLPCLSIETVKMAFDYFQSTNYNSYTAVVPTGDWIFDPNGVAITNSDPQNATTNKNQNYLKACHAFHIINIDFFRKNSILWTFEKDDPHLINIPVKEAVDVDTPLEFKLAELEYINR